MTENRAGMIESRKYATLSALLCSLRMGFRTLAIERRTGEVWGFLAQVRTEVGRFGDALDKARRQLSAAASSIEETGRRTRVLSRRLDAVERLNDLNLGGAMAEAAESAEAVCGSPDGPASGEPSEK